MRRRRWAVDDGVFGGRVMNKNSSAEDRASKVFETPETMRVMFDMDWQVAKESHGTAKHIAKARHAPTLRVQRVLSACHLLQMLPCSLLAACATCCECYRVSCLLHVPLATVAVATVLFASSATCYSLDQVGGERAEPRPGERGHSAGGG